MLIAIFFQVVAMPLAEVIIDKVNTFTIAGSIKDTQLEFFRVLTIH